MSLLFFDGFDFYATSDLLSRYSIATPGMTVVPGAGRFGTGALTHASGGGGESISKFFAEYTTWIIGVVYKTSTPGYLTKLLSLEVPLLDGTIGSQIELILDTSSRMAISANGGILATGTTTIVANTFYYMELKVTFSASCAANSCIARLNGINEVIVPSGCNTDPQLMGVASRVTLHWDNFHTNNVYDDLYICNGVGAINTDFLGDMRVETITPNAQGQYSDFSVIGALTHYGAINEAIADGDASYVASGTLNATESYRFPNLVSNPQSIAGLQVLAIARKDDAGSRALANLVRVAGVDYLGDDQGVPDSYVYLTSLFENNPATGLPWTGIAVNSLEAGFRVTR